MKEFFQNPVQTIRQSTNGYPLTDIYTDEEGNSVIEFALAGFSRDQIKVEVREDQKLTVSVTSGSEVSENEQRNIARRSFEKTFVDASRQYDLTSSDVSFVDGLLKITIPKREEVDALVLEVK
tara:strand:+ start:259 stop:627 length:369 start_codon:yes stop_codon:yes gene_type:complete